MASAEHIKALLENYINGDEAGLYSTAMQVAAHEAKMGHSRIARELRDLVDQGKSVGKVTSDSQEQPIQISSPKGELASLLSVEHPKTRLADIVLSDELGKSFERVISEHKKFAKISSYGLRPRSRLLLTGPPGTGKTFSAEVLAGELGLPLYRVNMESLFTKFLGETANKLGLIFEQIEKVRGVYLFDEFDSVGAQRYSHQDVGEISRVVNAFLRFLEGCRGQSVVLAATNSKNSLDYALFRRFDDSLEYSIPNHKQIFDFLEMRLGGFISKIDYDKEILEEAYGLSYAEIAKACDESIKDMILYENKRVEPSSLRIHISHRKEINQSK